MIEKSKILFVPAYYNNADQGWVNNFLEKAKETLNKLNLDYTQTSPLSDLDSIETIKFESKKQNYDVLVIYLITWIDPNVAVDLGLKLKEYSAIIWCSDYRVIDDKKQQTGAFAAFLPIKGSLEQLDFNAVYLYDIFAKTNTASELYGMVRAASAVSKLRTAKVAMVGNTALGIYPGMIHPLHIKKLFGTEIIFLDNYTLIELCKKNLAQPNLDKQSEILFKNFKFTESISEKQKHLCISMIQAIKELVKRNKLSAISLKCCYELAVNFGFAPCVPLSILSDECVTSCECDIPVTITQLILSYLTGQASPYADLLIMEEFSIHCACCGFGAFKYAAGNLRQIGCSQTGQNENELTFNRVINNSQYEPGVYTLARLNILENQKPYLQVILGEHTNDSEPFCEFGCKQYQNLSLRVKQPTSGIIQKIGSQHFAVMQGDVTNLLIHFCTFMDIEIQTFC